MVVVFKNAAPEQAGRRIHRPRVSCAAPRARKRLRIREAMEG